MNSKMPSPVGVLEITAEEYREQQVSEHAGDVFRQAEGKLRMLRDSGGGVALARLINALYNRHKALKFVDLMPLDRENRSLALARFTSMLTALSTTCALVRMRRPSMITPEPPK